ncbi:hypothetical protein M758_12G174200 [Ceratodon purpureus]|nr:hypothetical protein M758_12G174200 [Ceratodon purpureus]
MNCCQWLSTQRVDHLFSFWRRLTRYKHALDAAKQSHFNLRRRIIPSVEPSVQVHHGEFATYNGVPMFLHPGARMRSTALTTQSSIKCEHHWINLEPNNADGSEASTSAPTSLSLMQPEVLMMLHGQGYQAKPVPNWRKCSLILASRKAEFRPLEAKIAPEIRPLPESMRLSLPGCKLFHPQQIAHYNQMLRSDGKLESGVAKVAARTRTKPGRLYHKFDSLCALATSKAGRLLLIQHRELNHVFYPICYDPAHKLYIEWLNMYERRWFAVSESYGKKDGHV